MATRTRLLSGWAPGRFNDPKEGHPIGAQLRTITTPRNNAMRRVVVTGLGAVTPLGVGVKHTWRALLAGQSGVRSLEERGHEFDTLPSRVAGLVPSGKREDGGWDVNEWLSRDDQRRMAPFTHFAIAAAEEALASSNYTPTTPRARDSTGVTLGSGIGALSTLYDTSLAFSAAGHRKVSPLFVPRLLINLAAGHIAMRHGLRGPNTAPTSACTTGAHAIGDAAMLIACGHADVMLAGAAEACVHPLAVAGFARARSLSTGWNGAPERASKPFDKGRDGFVIGEGAGVLVLESEEHARERGAKVLAQLLGYGLGCDASHMTAPLEDGQGAARAMERALADANRQRRDAGEEITPRDVDYVNAHATGTPLGDVAEVRAIRRAMRLDEPSAPSPRTHPLYVSSTKGAIGHLLGAAGAVEAIFTILALQEGVVPATLNLEAPFFARGADAGADADAAVSGLEGLGDGIDFVAGEARVVRGTGRGLKMGMTNSFGFGGTNASLLFGRGDV